MTLVLASQAELSLASIDKLKNRATSGSCEENLKSNSYQRFLTLLGKVKKDGEGAKNLEQLIEAYRKNDTRGNIFRLEGLLRMFAQHADFSADFEKGYRKIRNFEDSLGHYIDSLKFQQRAIQLNLPELAGVISKRVHADHEVLTNFLESEWPTGQEIKWKEKYEDRFNQITGDAERKFLVSELTRFINEVQKKKYDLNKLQEGVHEYRRKLRWILLMAQASGGFFKLAESPALDKQYAKYLDGSGIREASFSKIPELASEKNPCLISRALFEMVTLAVFRIGEAKDSGELVENIAMAYEAFGDTKVEAHRKALKIGQAQKEYVDPSPMAIKWKGILDSEKILEKLSEEISICLPK